MKEVLFVDEFICDYNCKTVGESIDKYDIPDDWCAEFDAYDDNYPTICVQVDRVHRTPAMMNLKLQIVKNTVDEYPGCMIFPRQQTISFKIDYLIDLITVIEQG